MTARSRALVASVALVAALSGVSCRRASAPVVFTLGDVQAVHADVRVGGREIRGSARLSDGDAIATGPDGRARLRLDDATIVVLDANTELSLHGARLTLARGRLFVQGASTSRTEVSLGESTTSVSSSAAAFERRAGHPDKIYCAQGDLVVTAGSRQLRVSSGETATLDAKSPSVAPEKAFDDWTGGLAVPWTGSGARTSAMAELRGRVGSEDAGPPLVVRSQSIEATVDGELALTKTRTTYFNGTDQSVAAEVRLAIPEGAILSRVARRVGNEERDAALVIRRPMLGASDESTEARLEWAGSNALRGFLPAVPAGESVQLILEYAEWLGTHAGRATYRFPLAGSEEPALVGELRASVDLERAKTPWVSASAGAELQKDRVTLGKSDFRATGDLVVELAPGVVHAGSVRAYVAPAPTGEDPYLLVRAEVPEQTDPGLTLAVVLDTSMSVGSATLETERAVLDALLEGLGPRDSVAILAADQAVHAVGPEQPQSVTPELRAGLASGLTKLRPGGASNLGLALERAADVLDAPSRGARAGSGAVIYVGDGLPTVGDLDEAAVRRRLSRRRSGVPRVSAVAVGASANRNFLMGVVSGIGNVYDVVDRADAARVGATLLADALQPTLRDVGFDLGPAVDRVYPREARSALAGSTLSLVGRLRGELPSRVTLRFRDGERLVERALPLVRTPLPRGADVAQRWAAARLEDLVLSEDGVEPAISLAFAARLLTPATGFSFDVSGQALRSPPLQQRMFAPLSIRERGFSKLDPRLRGSSWSLLEPPETFGGGVGIAEAAEKAIRRILNQARQSVRACRDARAAVRPETGRGFSIDLVVAANGSVTRVQVTTDGAKDPDRVLERCVENVVKALPYFATGLEIHLNHTLAVPEGRGVRRTTCSAASKLSLPIRREGWRRHGYFEATDYARAARDCELPGWTDKREFLLVLLERTTHVHQRIALANALDELGETDAASFVRKEAQRRVTSFEELEELSQIVLAEEPRVDDELGKAYRAATNDEQRLAVVRRFLRLAPHSGLARRYLFALLEVTQQREPLLQEIEQVRADPFADAGLLAEGASALRRLGQVDEARRAFAELIERAPTDPWTLGFVGDRLRAERFDDEAVAAYETLSRLMPDDAGVELRLALAHAGAGRLDIATRLLERVAQTGGRGDDGRLGELASITRAVLLADARGTANSPEASAEITRRLLQTPLPDVASVMLVQSPPAASGGPDDPSGVRVEIAREKGDRDAKPADFDARVIGLAALRLERGGGVARLRLSRPADPSPTRPARVQIAALVLGEDRQAARLVTREVDVAADGKPVELKWNGEAFL